MSNQKQSLDDWLSVSEAANQAGITEQAIHNAISRGRLAAVPKSGILLIHRDEFARYRSQARRGRPKKPTEAA